MAENTEDPSVSLRASPSYAASQLARALQTGIEHPDGSVRSRAFARVQRWQRAIDGMVEGTLVVGSRQPISNTPIWATPQVLTGGFVTGELLAGGPLQEHEHSLAKDLLTGGEGTSRQALNAHFLTEAGFQLLDRWLESGCYTTNLPEEGALLAVAWLLKHGRDDEAHSLLDELTPQFATLRFYPVPTATPRDSGPEVFVESVGAVLQRLRAIHPNEQMLAQREAIEVWTVLYDEMVDLFLETVEGDTPTIQIDPNGSWIDAVTRKFHVSGGWPCRTYPKGWQAAAQKVVATIYDAREKHRKCGRSRNRDDAFVKLWQLMERCSERPSSLSGRDVGMIRLILARHLKKSGGRDSALRTQKRDAQGQQVASALHSDLAAAVLSRIAMLPHDGGVSDVSDALKATDEKEAVRLGIKSGTFIPSGIAKKVRRATIANIDTLVEGAIVTSGEVLAGLIPQLTSGIRSLGFADPALRRLYSSIYQSFRKRRSLLLLNYEKQVQLEELPWVKALHPFRSKSVSVATSAQQTLKEVAVLALKHFPQAILPNKLLRELVALAKTAEMDLPFVEELAADIFMGDFSPKFTAAAKVTAELVRDRLYARYYDLDCDAVIELPESSPSIQEVRRNAPPEPTRFATLCLNRAPLTDANGWSVARNGMIIEQAQVLTSHNLAVLFRAFDLHIELAPHLQQMAENCFGWVCRRLMINDRKQDWHAQLIAIKNSAYAWRQMVFYLSFLQDAGLRQFVAWCYAHLGKLPASLRSRIEPAVEGLKWSADWRLSTPNVSFQRFLGWTQGRHWLMSAADHTSQ